MHLANSKQQVRAALESRDGWRRALVRVALEHEPDDDGNCVWCGPDHRYPCRFVTDLERVSLGRARQVERFASMKEKELAAELREIDHDDDEDDLDKELTERAEQLATELALTLVGGCCAYSC